ncbi:DUF3293 domain-containing protein [Lewinella cohaerens]|uniref:DUF3293 domain-containing protein n=1 Tax=Lewinella cohaerens TaxID=70995 RepID=UPI00037E8A86|nr:DUF3293 domain-containing protein [Lewinella cohaerens]
MPRNKSQGFDEQLKTAYQQAIYRIFMPPISWKIGTVEPGIDKLLQANGAKKAIFLTASNPYSNICSVQKNKEANEALLAWIKENNYTFFEGQGEDPLGVWPPEQSFLILGINAKEALVLGQDWQQNAVVFVEANKPPTLLWCNGFSN